MLVSSSTKRSATAEISRLNSHMPPADADITDLIGRARATTAELAHSGAEEANIIASTPAAD
jgi:hypothetical protein